MSVPFGGTKLSSRGCGNEFRKSNRHVEVNVDNSRGCRNKNCREVLSTRSDVLVLVIFNTVINRFGVISSAPCKKCGKLVNHLIFQPIKLLTKYEFYINFSKIKLFRIVYNQLNRYFKLYRYCKSASNRITKSVNDCIDVCGKLYSIFRLNCKLFKLKCMLREYMLNMPHWIESCLNWLPSLNLNPYLY